MSTPAAQSTGSPQKPFSAKDLKGFKYFNGFQPLLERLHDNATSRDKAGNRRLFFDQYASLLLLAYFNPIITTLRGVQQASTLEKVQKELGCPRVALGSLSEASRVFDPQLLRGIFHDLIHNGNFHAQLTKPEIQALGQLTAVDGTLLRALPRMAWALWQDDQHRAAKMHLHFDVIQGIPREVSFTAGSDSEITQLGKLWNPIACTSSIVATLVIDSCRISSTPTRRSSFGCATTRSSRSRKSDRSPTRIAPLA